MADAALIETLRAADAAQFGEFEFSHGGMSSYYMDKYLFETDPRCLKLVAEAFTEHAADDDKPADITLGAIPPVTVAAVETDKPYVVTRRKAEEHGMAKHIEGAPDRGREVVILEDIAMIGQGVVDTVETFRKAGAVVDRAVVVVDQREGAAELLADHGTTLESFLTAEGPSADADD